MRTLLVLFAVAVGLVLTGCDSTSTASVGDCTDADPTLAIPGVTPDVVDCDSKRARSKIVAEEDDPGSCRTKAYVKTSGDTVFCVAPLPGRTFDDEMRKATEKGRQSQEEFQKQMDELKKRLRKQGEQGSP
jgi:hypothetical protein